MLDLPSLGMIEWSVLACTASVILTLDDTTNLFLFLMYILYAASFSYPTIVPAMPGEVQFFDLSMSRTTALDPKARKNP